MYKRLTFVCTLLCTLFMMTGMAFSADIERTYKKERAHITPAQYRTMFDRLVRTARGYKFYVVRRPINNETAHLYGCDATGQKKIYTDITYKDGNMHTVLTITIEGHMAEKEALPLADEIAESCLKSLDIY